MVSALTGRFCELFLQRHCVKNNQIKICVQLFVSCGLITTVCSYIAVVCIYMQKVESTRLSPSPYSPLICTLSESGSYGHVIALLSCRTSQLFSSITTVVANTCYCIPYSIVSVPFPHSAFADLLTIHTAHVCRSAVGAVDADEPDEELASSSGVRHLDLSSVRRFTSDHQLTTAATESGAGAQTPFDGLSRLFAGAEESVSLATSIVNEVSCGEGICSLAGHSVLSAG